MLQKKDKLPLIAFTLSRKRCDQYADMLISLDLTNGQEKHRIHRFFQKSVSILKGSDRELPQVKSVYNYYYTVHVSACTL